MMMRDVIYPPSGPQQEMVESHRVPKEKEFLLMTNSAVILIPCVVTLTTPLLYIKINVFFLLFFSGEKPQDRNQLNNSTLKKKKKKKKKKPPGDFSENDHEFSVIFLSRGKREPDGA
jgi:hypothetical protein